MYIRTNIKRELDNNDFEIVAVDEDESKIKVKFANGTNKWVSISGAFSNTLIPKIVDLLTYKRSLDAQIKEFIEHANALNKEVIYDATNKMGEVVSINETSNTVTVKLSDDTFEDVVINSDFEFESIGLEFRQELATRDSNKSLE